MHPRRKLLPEISQEYQRRYKLIQEFWTALYNGGDSGAATWESLDRICDRVTTALRRRPPDICLAERLTAKAALLINGFGKS